MDVIGRISGGVGLDVDEFDLEVGALDTVVAAFALFGAAGPAEADVFDSAAAYSFHTGLGYILGKTIGIFLNERPQNALLLTTELVGRDAFGRISRRLRRARSADLGGRLVGNGGFLLLIGGQRGDKIQSHALFLRADARTQLNAGDVVALDDRRIGAEG